LAGLALIGAFLTTFSELSSSDDSTFLAGAFTTNLAG